MLNWKKREKKTIKKLKHYKAKDKLIRKHFEKKKIVFLGRSLNKVKS